MRRLVILLFAFLLLWQGKALAHKNEVQPAAVPPAEEADVLIPSCLGPALSEEKLARQDGRQDIQIDQLNVQMSDMKNNATSSGNNLNVSNSTLTNGFNSIGQQAFSNASGIVTVIQNSGNQVLIQNDMLLNLWVK